MNPNRRNAMNQTTRRGFLAQSTLGSLSFSLAGLSPISAKDLVVQPPGLQLSPDTRPLVKMLESTPWEEALPKVITKLKSGLTYRQLLAALLSASVRVDGSPHIVYSIHAAHRIATALPKEQALLPLLWAVCRVSDGRRREGLRFDPPDLSTLSPETAKKEFAMAMRSYDPERATAALINLSRNIGSKAAFNHVWKYAGQNDGFIGHIAIGISNGWRVMETTGWQCPEPILQFVAHQLTHGDSRHATHKANLSASKKLEEGFAEGWQNPDGDHGATLEILSMMRSQKEHDFCVELFRMLQSGQVRAGSVWDAVHLASAESMFRWKDTWGLNQRALHHTTSSNAMRFAYESCADPRDKLYLLLQGATWATSFWRRLYSHRDMFITSIPEVEIPKSPSDAMAGIFASAPRRRWDKGRQGFEPRPEGSRHKLDQLSHQVFALAQDETAQAEYLETLPLMATLKATDIHDWKFTAATLENVRNVQSRWRPHLLAAHAHYMHGTKSDDHKYVSKARELVSGSGVKVTLPG